MSDNETAIAKREEPSLARLEEALLAVPGVDEDPTERMLELVASVDSPSEWNAIWDKLPSIQESEGRRFQLNDIRLRPSDFEGSDYYLLLDVTDLESGERKIVSSSSVMCNMQAATAWAKGYLPLKVEVRGPRKPTKAGFRPLHLHTLEPDELKRKAGVA